MKWSIGVFCTVVVVVKERKETRQISNSVFLVVFFFWVWLCCFGEAFIIYQGYVIRQDWKRFDSLSTAEAGGRKEIVRGIIY